jgi:two-component system sensor histidine kinase TtrS
MLVFLVNEAFADDITIGVRANRGLEKGIKKWQPTVDHLNNQIPEHHFVLAPYESHKGLSAAASRGEFHFVMTSPSS